MIHPEISSKVITKKHTFFRKIIMSRICYMRMFARQMTRDVRGKDMQIFYQIVTHLVRMKAVQLFPHRQTVDIRSISIEEAEVTHHISPESTRHVATVEKTPNEILIAPSALAF
jgi:hypothetical protein